MTYEAEILDMMGTPRLMGEDLVSVTRRGVPSTSAKRVLKGLGIAPEGIHRLLGTSASTFARRVRGRRPLDVVESDRFVRLLRVVAHAEDMLGSRRAAVEWLNSANRSLRGAKPLELLDTDAGVEMVADLLHRIGTGSYG